jgi:cobalt/nickel transport system permease protein
MRSNAGAKLAALLLLLVLISLSGNPLHLAPLAGLLLLLPAARRQLAPAFLILPFSGLLALTAWASGDGAAAVTLLVKSYLSIVSVLAFNAVTPATEWIATLRAWRVPAPLVDVLQFLHRYLWVVSGEARRMRIAAQARGGFRFDAAAGALGVLFARSWERGQRVHRAMLARGYDGRAL